MKNGNFHLINAYFFLINAVFNIFQTNIDIIVQNYKAFDQSDSTLFGVVFISAGLAGCFVFGWILSKWPKFKAIAIITALFHLLSYVAFVVTFSYYQSRLVGCILFGAIGFFNAAV